MITKTDLQSVNEELRAESRRRLGDPPTPEELLAYRRGELPPEEEGRIRELLVAYPELARSLAEPFPTEGAEPGDPDYLSDEEMARHWTSIQQRLGATANAARSEASAAAPPAAQPAHDGRVLQFWRRASFALAAMLVLAFSGLLWQLQSARQLGLPLVASEERQLFPDGRRGGGESSVTLARGGDAYLLVASMLGREQFATYRVDIVDPDTDSAKALWSSPDLQRRDDGAFRILVPQQFLKPDRRYQIVIYGINGPREERLAGYTFHVER
jgi:hypothetical protein